MPEQNTEIIREIIKKCSEGDFYFRGTNKVFSKEKDGISSSLYRFIKSNLRTEKFLENSSSFKAEEETEKFLENYSSFKAEEEIVERAKRYFPNQSTNLEILTELRHFGGRVNMIDFTQDLYIALFYACTGDIKKNGEVIAIERKKEKGDEKTSFDEKKDIDYNKPSEEPFWLVPAFTKTSRNRALIQKSHFLYVPKGFLEKGKYHPFVIEKEQKKGILDYLKKFHGIDETHIYNDLIGFIANEKNFEGSALFFYQGNVKMQKKEYKEAIEDYDKAIELNPKFAVAYYNRGVAKGRSGDNEGAEEDFAKAKELGFSSPNQQN